MSETDEKILISLRDGIRRAVPGGIHIEVDLGIATVARGMFSFLLVLGYKRPVDTLFKEARAIGRNVLSLSDDACVLFAAQFTSQALRITHKINTPASEAISLAAVNVNAGTEEVKSAAHMLAAAFLKEDFDLQALSRTIELQQQKLETLNDLTDS